MSTPEQFYEVASLALDCVCAAMTAAADEVEDYPGCPTCYQYVSAGDPVVDCCTVDCNDAGGMLTVHLENVFPSDNFPNPSAAFDPCKAASWVASLVVTAARCSPTMDEAGNAPSNEELSDHAHLMSVDTYAILQGLSCCLPAEAVPGKRKRRVQITGMLPQTSEGGCSSIEVRAFVEAGPVCGCPPEAS